jgi:hypothetical protein
MVNFKSITDKAKDLVEKRGGSGSVKEDAGELKDIAAGKGSITDKAKAAAAALKDPGADGEEKPEAAGSPEAPTRPPAGAKEDADKPRRRDREDRPER